MASVSTETTWDEAVKEYLLHVQATRTQKTVRFYDVQLRQLLLWTDESLIRFGEFGKRHLDRYLVFRQQGGKSLTTVKHDAVAAKAFFRWCSRNDILDRSPLAEYKVMNTPEPARYMPSEEEVLNLLQAVRDHWNLIKNPAVRFYPITKRIFHRDRAYAILLGLLDSACRIGEMLNRKVGDVQHSDRQILIREAKGKRPRTLPVSEEWLDALDEWLKIRKRLMSDVSAGEDEGWLFVSKYGGRIGEGIFFKSTKRIIRWAKLSDEITLHGLRRFSLNRLAKHNLLAAQQIAGHRETKTTLMYTKLDADFIRDMHAEVGIVKGIVMGKKERRKKLI